MDTATTVEFGRQLPLLHLIHGETRQDAGLASWFLILAWGEDMFLINGTARTREI